MSGDLSALFQKKLWILDLDGTVYLGDRLFDATLPFLSRVQENGAEYLFFTNNASRSRRTYVGRLRAMGIPVSESQILTSAETTLAYLDMVHAGERVYLLGTPDLVENFREHGIILYNDDIEQDHPDSAIGYPFNITTAEGQQEEAQYCPVVVVSFDLTLTYEKVSTACRLIRNGAVFLSTHPDLNCPVEGGFIPDSGSICAMITASTGLKPRYFGKPYPDVVNMIEHTSGLSRRDMVFVGDRLYTDIAVGADNGTDTVLVFSGETSPQDLAESTVRPSYTASSIDELLR